MRLLGLSRFRWSLVSKLSFALASCGWLLSSAASATSTPDDFVAVNLAQLQLQMGIQVSDSDYCSRSSDVCEDMCTRFVAEGIVPDSCEVYCSNALPECSEE